MPKNNNAKLVTINGYLVKFEAFLFFTDKDFKHRPWMRTAKTGETVNGIEWGRLEGKLKLKRENLTPEECEKAKVIVAQLAIDPYLGLTPEEKEFLKEKKFIKEHGADRVIAYQDPGIQKPITLGSLMSS